MATDCSSCMMICCVSESVCICCWCDSSVSRYLRLSAGSTTPLRSRPAVGGGSGGSGGAVARPSFVTDFIGSVTTHSCGSVPRRSWSCGATWMRKRCLSRCDESDVIRSLKVAAPCNATTSVSPTSSGSDDDVCFTGSPFSYNRAARSGSEQSRMGMSRWSCTPTLSMKGLRFETTSSSSGSSFSFVRTSTLCTRCSRILSFRPAEITAVLPSIGITIGMIGAGFTGSGAFTLGSPAIPPIKSMSRMLPD
mmetsp:Transcript_11797/g.20178  ORF Transcript_11797/g.20178 Transcript_11797/m.20178 type:complete len:250 (-) Transcript_11797:85-834(-)